MGELDEAIRQHIALKRQHGAPDSELKELEQEAFGPAERPAAPSEVTPAEAHAVPELFREQPGEPSAEPVDEPGPPASDAPPVVDIPTEESAPPFEAEEREHPEPGPEPGPEIPPPPPSPEPAPPEPPPPAAEPGQETDPEAELGLAPDDGPSFFDQDVGEAEEAEPEQPAGDTGEESLYDELDALLGDDEPGEAAVEEEPEEEAPPREPEDSAEEGESLLEETPDFLQDAPEQDDLWFDQQPPKDFDFDD